MLERQSPRKPPSARPPRADCCVDAECTTGLRNNYFPGKQLTPDALSVEQGYLIERRHLLNRAIHGWGVVYGYPVTAEKPGSGRLVVGAGLALDRAGRELLLGDARVLRLDEVIALDEHGARIATDCKDTVPPWRKGCWLLSAHYAEQPVGPTTPRDRCGCERQHWDRVCETVRFSVRWVDCADCCKPAECELCCSCGTGPCCDERRKEPARCGPENPVSRGGCRCLCDHLTHLWPDAECNRLDEIIESCGTVRVDLHNGVPLACVGLVRDECEPWKLDDWIEACGPRRLVKRNDLLFDLVQGCDLTRISVISWYDWHRSEEPIPFDVFSQAFGPQGQGEYEYETYFWVEFSRPVRKTTLRPDCFAIGVMSADEDAWWSVRRIPVVRVDTTLVPPERGDPAGYVRSARIVVDGTCVEEGVRGRKCLFVDGETRVEIEIRGDFIVDCNGQTVDANAVGLSPFPTGNGTPGGTFVSTFCVAPREISARPYGSAARTEGV